MAGNTTERTKKKRQFIQMQELIALLPARLPLIRADLTFRTMLYEAAVTVALGRRNLQNPPRVSVLRVGQVGSKTALVTETNVFIKGDIR